MTRHSLLIKIFAACATVLSLAGIVRAQGAETVFVEKMASPELLAEVARAATCFTCATAPPTTAVQTGRLPST
jgi:hypothetical protein